MTTVRVLVAGFCLAALETMAPGAESAELIPWPRSIEPRPGELLLKPRSRIVATEAGLAPLAVVLADEIRRLTGLQMAAAEGAGRPGDIELVLDDALAGEAYTLTIAERATVAGGNYQAVAWGTVTLLQTLRSDGNSLEAPCLLIRDEPRHAFRGVMVDVARRWHPLDTLKDTVELLRFYKLGYLHLHLSDKQSMTFSSRAFPALATPGRSYSREELLDLDRFARERGVTIIPEVDVPGHCGSWVGKYPELFGTTDPATGQSRNAGLVNMANENAYKALDTLVGELCDTFRESPYIHLGADEVDPSGLVQLPEYQPYCRAHGLESAAAGKPHELYCHFVVRMSQIIKKHGRTAMVWNGFPCSGTPDVAVPKHDIVVDAWNGSPRELAEQGYRLVNCCWLPLYIVPPSGLAPSPELIYAWNPRTANWWGNPNPVEIPTTGRLLGAKVCLWEQQPNLVIPLLRPRMAAFSERLWNPEAGRSFADFLERYRSTDRAVTRMVRPVGITAQGLTSPDALTFESQVTVQLKSDVPGTIRYTLSKGWDEFPKNDSAAYEMPFPLDGTATISAQVFDAEGQAVGGVTQERFSKMTPAYTFKVIGPAPQPPWTELPDFTGLEVLRSGVTGLMTRDRGEQINRDLFHGISLPGHIDVRVPGLWNPYAIELEGRLSLPAGGRYAFKVRSRDGQTALVIGGKGICHTRQSGVEMEAVSTLEAGVHPLLIRHYWRSHANDLNILFKGPGMTAFEPLEKVVVPIAEWDKSSAGRAPR